MLGGALQQGVLRLYYYIFPDISLAKSACSSGLYSFSLHLFFCSLFFCSADDSRLDPSLNEIPAGFISLCSYHAVPLLSLDSELPDVEEGNSPHVRIFMCSLPRIPSLHLLPPLP